MSNPKRKIIDFRNRPPLKPYKGLFDLKNNVLMKSHAIIKNRGANTSSPAIEMVPIVQIVDTGHLRLVVLR